MRATQQTIEVARPRFIQDAPIHRDPGKRAQPARPNAPPHALLTAFVFVELWLILAGPLKGPFLDEGIYITAGERTIEGHGIADAYLTWFAGHLIWPVMSAIAYRFGGLDGSRMLALAFVATAVWASDHAARNLFGAETQGWTVAFLVVSAPTLALGHLAVYDAPAAAFLALAFAALTELDRTESHVPTVLAAISFGLAALTKYPVLSFVPVLVFVLVAMRRRARADLLLFGLVTTAVLLCGFLPVREQLATFLHWRVANNPSFGATRKMILYDQALFIVPCVALALLGAILTRQRKLVAFGLGVTCLLFPAYHVLIGNAVGASKHVLYGMLLAGPVVGLALHTLAQGSAKRLVAVAVFVGALLGVSAHIVPRLDDAWADTTKVAGYLASHVGPTDTMLISNRWPLMPTLYNDGLLDDPAQVVDAYGVEHRSDLAHFDPCSFDWVVDEQRGYAWTDDFRAELSRCGTYHEVFRSEDIVSALGRSLHTVSWPVTVVVWRHVDA